MSNISPWSFQSETPCEPFLYGVLNLNGELIAVPAIIFGNIASLLIDDSSAVQNSKLLFVVHAKNLNETGITVNSESVDFYQKAIAKENHIKFLALLSNVFVSPKYEYNGLTHKEAHDLITRLINFLKEIAGGLIASGGNPLMISPYLQSLSLEVCKECNFDSPEELQNLQHLVAQAIIEMASYGLVAQLPDSESTEQVDNPINLSDLFSDNSDFFNNLFKN